MYDQADKDWTKCKLRTDAFEDLVSAWGPSGRSRTVRERLSNLADLNPTIKTLIENVNERCKSALYYSASRAGRTAAIARTHG